MRDELNWLLSSIVFDLVRTNRALEVFNAKGISLSENSLLFPIPLVEKDINPELTQNPGY